MNNKKTTKAVGLTKLLRHDARALHVMKCPPGYRCACGAVFDDYWPLAEHVRQSITCPSCGAVPAILRNNEAFRWMCGHWIARGDVSAAMHTDKEELPIQIVDK